MFRRKQKMFRELRRCKQFLSPEEIKTVLLRCTNGVLAFIGDNGYPYAVPLSYVYYNEKIYFHSAKAGHKIESIKRDPRISLAVIDEDAIVSGEFTSYFTSVIAFGKARIVEGQERIEALRAFVEKYSGDQPQEIKEKNINGCMQSHIVAIDIEYLTGKQAEKLVKKKALIF